MPSRRRATEDSDDDAGPSAPRRSQWEKNDARRRAERQKEAEEDDDDDDDDDESDDDLAGAATGVGGTQHRKIGAAEIKAALQPQPLEMKTSEAKLKALVSDWAQCNRNLNTVAQEIVSVAERHTEYASSTDNMGMTQQTKELEDDIRQTIDMQIEVEIRKRALDSVRAQVTRGDKLLDAEGLYKRLVDAELQKYHAKTARQRYASDKVYIDFRTKVWEASNEYAMPPIADFIEGEAADGEDDEIVAGAAKTDYRCPVSARIIDDPVSATGCGHSYNRISIADYIAQQHENRVKCPVAGCESLISKSSLKDNPKLAAELKTYRRRHERREEMRRTQQQASTLID